MDYLKLIIEGISNSGSKKVLDKYFVRKYREAKEKHFSPEEFFNGCMEVVDALYADMDRRFYERKNELYIIRGWKEKGMNGDADTPKKPSGNDLKEVKEIDKELSAMSRGWFPVHLLGFSKGAYLGNLYEEDVDNIARSLTKAMDSELNMEATKTPNPKISIWDSSEELMKSHEYNTAESQGGMSFTIQEKKYFVKSIGLAAILASNGIKGRNMKTNEEVIIKGKGYYDELAKGYEEGEEYFLKTFRENQFQSKETIVDDLHLKYYHDSKESKRWKDYVTGFPVIITKKVIKEWGYYQGVVRQLEKMIDEHPTLFKDFHKCIGASEYIETKDFGGSKESDLSAVYERSIRINKKADKETAKRLRCKEGETYSIIPEPTSKAELFERFEKLHCQALFEAYQRAFKKMHGKGNRKVIEDELKELSDFVDKASALSTVDTFKPTSQGNDVEYSRLMYGYYQNKEVHNFSVHYFFEGAAIAVYARYVMYKKWLENKLQELVKNEDVSLERFSPILKAGIVLEIIGDNDWNTTSPVFHHIKSILEKHSITSKEATEIMLDMQGMNSPNLNMNVIEPIIGYLGKIDFEPKKAKSNSVETNAKKSSVPSTFEEIFCVADNASLSLNALTQTEPPIVDKNGKYNLGQRQKGSITAWVEAMRQKGIIITISDSDLAVLINEKIKGLDLGSDGRTLRNLGTSAYNKYYSSLLNLLP